MPLDSLARIESGRSVKIKYSKAAHSESEKIIVSCTDRILMQVKSLTKERMPSTFYRQNFSIVPTQ